MRENLYLRVYHSPRRVVLVLSTTELSGCVVCFRWREKLRENDIVCRDSSVLNISVVLLLLLVGH